MASQGATVQSEILNSGGGRGGDGPLVICYTATDIQEHKEQINTSTTDFSKGPCGLAIGQLSGKEP